MPAQLSENAFVGLPLITLQALQTAYHTGILEVVTLGQSYSIEGRTVTKANLNELKETLREISDAIDEGSVSSAPKFARAIFR